MGIDEIESKARRTPFSPFALVLSTGEELPVHYPDLILFSMRSLTVGVVSDPKRRRYDFSHTIDPRHVVGIKEIADESLAPT